MSPGGEPQGKGLGVLRKYWPSNKRPTKQSKTEWRKDRKRELGDFKARV